MEGGILIRTLKQYDNSFDIIKSLLDTEARYDIRKEFIKISKDLSAEGSIFRLDQTKGYFSGWDTKHPYGLRYCNSVIAELEKEMLTNKIVKERLMAMANNML